MIAHILPILAVTAGMGVRAVPMPAPQGVTALLTPGPILDGCSISSPGVYGISIQPVNSAAAASSASAAGGAAAAASAAAGGAGGAASAASAAGVGDAAEKLRRQAVTQILDGQIQAPAAGAAAGGSAAPGSGAAAAAAAAAGFVGCPDTASATPAESAAAGVVPQTPEEFGAPGPIAQAATPAPPAGAVTQIADGQIQAPSAVGAATGFEGVAANPAASVANVVVPQTPQQCGAPGPEAIVSEAAVPEAAAPVTSAVPVAAPPAPAAGAVTQIADGQIQAPSAVGAATGFEGVAANLAASVANVVVPQTPQQCGAPGPEAIVSEAAVPEAAAPVASAVPVAAPPAPAAGAVTQIADGQIQAPSAVGAATGFEGIAANPAVNVANVVVPQTPQQCGTPEPEAIVSEAAVPEAAAPVAPVAPVAPAVGAVTQIADGQIQAPQKRSILKVRQNGLPVRVTLEKGVLTDHLGRTGYIADNRQLQFDAPPQGGAIYTAGFSACPDGSLGLGGSNVFYACGSSDFSNLYDTPIYPDNCHEVYLMLG